ncbi:MAG: DUF2029 domain-containing protein [Chloroflexi bacterium]|nr:DUF2029 domain-containing protein [Chloroflexota bacterium]
MDKQRLIIIALAILLPIVFVADVIFTHNAFTVRFPGGNDSVPRYVGAQAWFFERLSPYSDEVTDRAQKIIYGRLAKPEEDKQRFAYPFYVIFFYLPLTFFTWDWAQAIGIVVLEFALVAMTIFSLRLYRWSPPPLVLAFTVLWTIIFYHGTRTIILVQFAGIAALLIVVGLWAIKEKRDVLGGVALALASAKPQWLLWEWWQVKRDQDSTRLDWVIALTLIITNMIVTRTATTNYVMMLPALFYMFKVAADRFGAKANVWIVMTELILFIGIWMLFAFTLKGRDEQWQVYLPLPLMLLAGMIVFRPKQESRP